ncbi:MAG: Fic family protein [Alphaproteobacteria bacterium]|nr:Fic family protein [Alphaproteobacteria bacterium]
MSDDGDDIRHSKAEAPTLIEDPVERAEQEARNALLQFDVAKEAIDSWTTHSDRPFRLRPSLILSLHRTALDGLSAFAGVWRPAGVEIGKSKHEPPGGHLVPELVEEMCDYINENWATKSAVHLASYVMWRLNWIHPFDDGNGRTSRAISYVVLCVRTGQSLPGKYTIPEQISENKTPYYEALEAADVAWINCNVDISAMETLMEGMLAKQLADVLDKAINPESNAVTNDPTLH